jgi:hypothetical protein
MAGKDLTAITESNIPRVPREKNRPVPKKVRAACDALVSGDAKTITAAAEKAGLTREYLSRQFGKQHVVDFLRAKAARTVAIAAGRASARVAELINAESEHVSFDASKHVLAIAGIKPVGESPINLNFDAPKAGYVIILAGRAERDRPLVDVTPAKPAGEHHDEH